MMWFIDGSGFRRIVHRFKYSSRPALARDFGRWFGHLLSDTDDFGGLDLIVPVPLHPLKTLRRGYNQSEWIARGMSRQMDIPTETRAVARRVNNPSQTSLIDSSARWSNVEGIFSVRRPELLADKRILLVDDVLTSGATLVSCASAIASAVPSCRISVATLFASRRGLGISD